MKSYTYLIKHRPTGQVYYGYRSANKTNPVEDLWQNYFTSSSRVHQLIKETGVDSFDVEIRKTFESKEQASSWETRVLRRCKVLTDDRWINQNIAGYIMPSKESRKKISDYHKDKPKTEKHKQKISESQKGSIRPWSKANLPKDTKGANNGMYGRSHSEEAKKKIGEKNRIHMQGENNPMKKIIWTEERKEHMRQVRARRGEWTEEQKKAVADKLRGQKRPKLHCAHCARDIAVGWYDRHGDNCKQKEIK
jgi:hypothetical protein